MAMLSDGVAVSGATVYRAFESFEDYGLDENLLRGIHSFGLQKPQAMQRRGIKPIVDGRDTIGEGKAGIHMIVTFLIGCMQRIDYTLNRTQALILASTRELADHIYGVSLALGEYLQMRNHVCIGAAAIHEDVDKLWDGPQLVVGTSDRIHKMVRSTNLQVDSLRIFVLYEVDELVSLGFKDQIYGISECLPHHIQVCLFAATMSPDVLAMSSKFLYDPVHSIVRQEQLVLDDVRHFYVNVQREDWKLDVLCDLYEFLASSQAVIYINTCRKVDWVQDQLTKQDFNVSCIHGDLDRKERDLVMREFQSGCIRILLSTDRQMPEINARQTSFIINYDLPEGRTSLKSYCHRSVTWQTCGSLSRGSAFQPSDKQ